MVDLYENVSKNKDIVMEPQKSCQNCKYFIQYYRKDKKRFVKMGTGHCRKHTRKSKYFTVCDDWEDAAILKTESRQSIYQTIEKMQKNLEDIAILLKNDN